MNANAEIIAELRRVLNERDEAREQLDLTKRELGRWVDRETKAVRERDEARTACPDCAMWAERSARWHDDMQRAERERDEARANYQWMVDRACDEKLDGYRELGAKCAQLEEERDEARAEVEHAYREGGALYEAKIAEREAFRSGAEAMREACAREVVEGRQNSHEGVMQWLEDIASDLRDLPIPEET